MAGLALALLGGCSGTGALNTLSAHGSAYTLQTDVPYGPLPRQKLDIYTPTAAAPARGWPMVVFLYGGTWRSGERGDYRFVGAALATKGMQVLVADYRLYPEVRYPDFVADSAKAVAYGLSQARRLGADPGRVFLMGHSAGAYNAAMVALDARWLRAEGQRPQALAGWIGLAGPYDFYPTENPDVQPVFFHPDYPPRSQPIGFAPADAPPTFLGAASDDPLVSPERNAQAMAQRLRAAGVPVTLRLYPRASHVTLIGALAWPLRWAGPVLDDVRAFVDAPRAADGP
ncbi:alpha/beta hydrolase [Xenophilus arseniciresistens]